MFELGSGFCHVDQLFFSFGAAVGNAISIRQECQEPAQPRSRDQLANRGATQARRRRDDAMRGVFGSGMRIYDAAALQARPG